MQEQLTIEGEAHYLTPDGIAKTTRYIIEKWRQRRNGRSAIIRLYKEHKEE